ncbi:MAG TPA: hypothetical protein VHH36_03730 [Candidatus Thermoplasmatota archaeon]|nr:hypothetical protein [Candidatus Thermoplasmatota archaeon]
MRLRALTWLVLLALPFPLAHGETDEVSPARAVCGADPGDPSAGAGCATVTLDVQGVACGLRAETAECLVTVGVRVAQTGPGCTTVRGPDEMAVVVCAGVLPSAVATSGFLWLVRDVPVEGADVPLRAEACRASQARVESPYACESWTAAVLRLPVEAGAPDQSRQFWSAQASTLGRATAGEAYARVNWTAPRCADEAGAWTCRAWLSTITDGAVGTSDFCARLRVDVDASERVSCAETAQWIGVGSAMTFRDVPAEGRLVDVRAELCAGARDSPSQCAAWSPGFLWLPGRA